MVHLTNKQYAALGEAARDLVLCTAYQELEQARWRAAGYNAAEAAALLREEYPDAVLTIFDIGHDSLGEASVSIVEIRDAADAVLWNRASGEELDCPPEDFLAGASEGGFLFPSGRDGRYRLDLIEIAPAT